MKAVRTGIITKFVKGYCAGIAAVDWGCFEDAIGAPELFESPTRSQSRRSPTKDENFLIFTG